MKIDNTHILEGLEKDKPLKDQHEKQLCLGKALAEILLSAKASKFDKMKTFNLSQNFYNEKSTDVDASDLVTIKEIIEKDERYNALIDGQILNIFNNLKEEEKPKEETKK